MEKPAGPKRSRTTLYVVLGLIVLAFLLSASGASPLLGLLIFLGLAGYGFIRLTRALLRRSRLIWSMRNRLIVTYVFIGVVPIVLILVLAYVGTWIVVGQFATYLVSSGLTRRAQTLEQPARFLAATRPADRPRAVEQLDPLMRMRDPGFAFVIADATGEPFRYPADSTLTPPAGSRDFSGIAYRDGRYYTIAVAHNNGTVAAVLAPITKEILENAAPGIGTVVLYHSATGPASGDIDPKITVGGRAMSAGTEVAGALPPAYNSLDREFPWLNPIETVTWTGSTLSLLSVTTRISAVLNAVFADRVDFGQGIGVIFLVLTVVFALVEITSFAIGVSMTRAVTGAVHNLYQGTLRIGAGDFSHRIPVRGEDQLADLSDSFNKMTEQIGTLVLVAKEKERLQSELAIASEVQNRLFPRSAPPSTSLQLIGACEPARSVSGDYYDYLSLPGGNLGIAIGDVAGKGISAALLMASIQSIMRTQLASATAAPGVVASVVSQLNRQLYANTSTEKYATFFFGLYDEQTRALTYTNAGHLSPLLIGDGNVRELETTGMVVGIFPAAPYEERTVHLASGDLLVAYTDGITEPENAYGEEFGAERLTDAVLRNLHAEPAEIVAKIMEAVKNWSSAPELPDDMTVLIAKGIA
jgi:sigma-B regulation protein RsbU (phosphoserine phosphatase)